MTSFVREAPPPQRQQLEAADELAVTQLVESAVLVVTKLTTALPLLRGADPALTVLRTGKKPLSRSGPNGRLWCRP